MVESNPNIVHPEKGQTRKNFYTLNEDLSIMIQHAVDRGIELPGHIKLDVRDDDVLINNYNTLQKAIHPATVESIRYIRSEMWKKKNNRSWFQIPIFTKCVLIAFIALLLLIGISLSPIINVDNQARGLLESSGTILLYNLIFICSASLVGVMFYLLKTIGSKIRNYTLKASDSIELNASILIGVISGFVISELFTFAVSDISSIHIEIQKMTLALLGGFSSDAIFSILQGIVNKIKGLISK